MNLVDTVSGACGAICCVYAGLPLDVAKVRLQNQLHVAQGQAPRYRGVCDCLLRTLLSAGPGALYKGALPALSSALCENAVGITVQRAASRQLALAYGDPHLRFSLPTECALGGFTGIFTSLAMCPFEVAKVRLQASSGIATGAGLSGCIRDILRYDGIRGFYRGLTSLWARDIPFNAFFFGSYEFICTAMMRMQGCRSKDDLGAVQVMCAGGLAGATGWSLVIPCDVVKTRLQSGEARGTFMQVMRSIARTEGVTQLFAGWGAAVARAFPANAGLFFGVEWSSRWLKSLLVSREQYSQGLPMGLPVGEPTVVA